jgi:hypothetical protein
MPGALDPLPLLKHLHAHGVEHIIIGGFAVSAHGHVRPSKDARDAEVSDFDQAEIPMSAMRLDDLVHGGNFRLVSDLGDVDVFQWVSGIEADDLCAELARDALAGDVEGIPVRVCGLDASSPCASRRRPASWTASTIPRSMLPPKCKIRTCPPT